MVSQPIRTHIVLECDGSGNMLCVFSDSVDRLKWVLGGQNFWMMNLTRSYEFFARESNEGCDVSLRTF